MSDAPHPGDGPPEQAPPGGSEPPPAPSPPYPPPEPPAAPPPTYEPPPAPTYEPPATPPAQYEAPAAPTYEPPAAPPPTYEPPAAPTYEAPAAAQYQQPAAPPYPPPAAPQYPQPGAPSAPSYQQPPTPPQYQPAPGAPPGYGQPPAGQYPGQYPQTGPPAPKSGNSGCIKALIIGIIVVVLLGIAGAVGTVLLVRTGVDNISKTFGVADSGDYSIDQNSIDCSVSDTGAMKATGKFTNKTNHNQSFSLTVQFVDSTTNSKLGEDPFVQTGSLSGGQSTTFTATTYAATTQTNGIKCVVSEVRYFGS